MAVFKVSAAVLTAAISANGSAAAKAISAAITVRRLLVAPPSERVKVTSPSVATIFPTVAITSPAVAVTPPAATVTALAEVRPPVNVKDPTVSEVMLLIEVGWYVMM